MHLLKICWIWVFLLPLCSLANVDSLKNVINTTVSSADKIDALNQLGKELYFSDNEAARDYLHQSFGLLKQNNYPKKYAEALINYGSAIMVLGRFSESRDTLNNALLYFDLVNDTKNSARVLMDIGTSYYYEGKVDSALIFCNMALPKLDSFPKKKAKLYNNMGIFSKHSGDYEAAIDYYIKGLTYFQQVNDTALTIATQNNIGAMFTKYQQFDKAFIYHEEAILLSEITKDIQGLARGYAGIAQAQDYLTLYKEAILNNKKAIGYFEELGLKKDILSIQHNLASAYYSLEEYDKALPLFSTLLDEFILINATPQVAVCVNSIGLIYYKKEELDSATVYLEKAYELQQLIDNPTMLKSMLISLSKLYETKGEFDKALAANDYYETIKDSLYNLEEAQRIAQKEAIFRFENKMNDLEEKESQLSTEKEVSKSLFQKNTFVITGIGVAFFIGILLIGYYSKKRKETKNLFLLKENAINKYTSLENAYSEIFQKLEGYHPTNNEKSLEWLSLLSKRELEVLTCLSVGLTDNEISEKLFVSKATVNSHCNRIYKKLKVKNRSEAAGLAREIDLA